MKKKTNKRRHARNGVFMSAKDIHERGLAFDSQRHRLNFALRALRIIARLEGGMGAAETPGAFVANVTLDILEHRNNPPNVP